jgi:REP element-mobilizing transposase RayT
VHFVWATYKRLPLIKPQFEPRLYSAMADKCRELGCHPLAIGGVEDHVHLFVRFTPTVVLARLMKEV